MTTPRSSRTVTVSPVKPAPGELTSFGLSFAPSFGPGATERRAKADADAQEVRRDALPALAAIWSERLTFAEQEAWASVRRLYAENGNAPVAIPRAVLAERLAVSPDEADKLLNSLSKAGAITRNLRLQSAPSYVPVTAPPAPTRATKADVPKRPDPSAVPRLRSALGICSRW